MEPESGDDRLLVTGDVAETAYVAPAVDERRSEFATVRAGARRAVERLGVPSRPALPARRGGAPRRRFRRRGRRIPY
jgi:4'-phosphopantetheinyl transferase EntD